MNTDPEFPLDQWFDISKRISRDDMELAEAQMALYAVKEGLAPDCAEARQEYRRLRNAVKRHNEAFRHASAKP
jgi:hypothetical protein